MIVVHEDNPLTLEQDAIIMAYPQPFMPLHKDAGTILSPPKGFPLSLDTMPRADHGNIIMA